MGSNKKAGFYCRFHRHNKWNNIFKKLVVSVTLFQFFAAQIAFAQQQIVADGRTQTTLDISGNTTDINTATQFGQNAFNSFSKFDVYNNNVVNLHVPDAANNLLNLVNGPSSNISGILNSYKNGSIGGNIFFANPNGFVVGQSGVVNVGSLTVRTPTQGYMDSFFDAADNPLLSATTSLLDGTAPINPDGLISIDGQINALDRIDLTAGRIANSGNLISGSGALQAEVDFTGLVNVGDLVNGSGVVVKEGEIHIVAFSDVNITGKVRAEGADNIDGGAIDIRAGQDIVVTDGAVVSAMGQGENSSGGNIYVWADNRAELSGKSLLDVRGGATGDGGFAEFSAKNIVALSDSSMQAGALSGLAGSILVDPATLDLSGKLTINSASYFTGGNGLFQATDTINVADSTLISSRSIFDVAGGDHLNDLSTGDSGSLTFEAATINIGNDAQILAHASIGYQAGDIIMTATDVSSSIIPHFDINETSAGIFVGQRSILKGNNISLDASAISSNTFVEDPASPDGLGGLVEKSLDFIDYFTPFPVSYSKSTADAEVRIGTGSTIEAANDLSLTANSTANAEADTVFTGLGISVGETVSDARVVVQSGIGAGEVTTITSGRDLDINATSNTDLKASASTVNLGSLGTLTSPVDFSVAYSNSESLAQAKIGQGSDLTVGGNLAVAAITNKSLATSALAKAYDDGAAGIALAISDSNGQTSALLDGTAKVTGKVDVLADVNILSNEINASGGVGSGIGLADIGSGIVVGSAALLSKITGASGNTSMDARSSSQPLAVAGAFAKANHDEQAVARIGGSNLVFDALDMVDTGNGTISFDKAHGLVTGEAVSYDNVGGSSVGGLADGTTYYVIVVDDHTVKLASTFAEAMSDTGINFSGAGAGDQLFSYSSGATVKADGSVTVKADLENNNPEISAIATIDSDKLETNPNGNTKDNSISAAIIVADYRNSTEAYIGKNAIVDSKADLIVEASTRIPYAIDWFQLGWDSLLDKFNSDFGIQNGAFTSWAQSSAQGDKTATAGSVNIIDFANSSRAFIDEGAAINQDLAYRTASQEVAVTAENDIQTVNLAGVFDFGNLLGGSGGKSGVGGAYLNVGYTTTTEALIKDTARLYGESLLVRADTNTNDISIAEAGGSASSFALGGSFSLLTTDNNTLAQIDEGATVVTGNKTIDLGKESFQLFGDDNNIIPALNTAKEIEDIPVALDSDGDGQLTAADEHITGFDVANQAYTTDLNQLVVAEDESRIFNLGGGIVKAKNVGIGTTISINEITRDTRSLIGNQTGQPDSATGSLTAGGDLLVAAVNNGQIDAYSLAAAVANPSQVPTSATDSGGGKFGLGISADVSLNTINDTAEAYVGDAVISGSTNLDLRAVNASNINTFAGGVTLTNPNDNSSGVGGSYTQNTIRETTSVHIDNSTVTLTSGDLNVEAETGGEIWTISAGGSLAGRGLGVAGSVSINDIGNTTEAYLQNSNVVKANGVNVEATDISKIFSVAGSLSLGGKAGFGAAFSKNVISNTTEAYLSGSDADADGLITVEARSGDAAEEEIGSYAAALNLGADNLAVAVSITSNEITNETLAYVDGTKTVAGIKAAGGLNLTAIDDADITGWAGNLTMGGSVGFGVAISTNDINNDVKTYLNNTTVETQAGVALDSDFTSKIENAVIAGAANDKAAIGGSVSINSVSDDIEAYVKGSSVTANGSSGDVTLSANEDAEISSLAGNLTFAARAAFGASVSTNTLGNGAVPNKVKAYIEDSTVTVDNGKVGLDSSSNSLIKNITAAGTAGLQNGAVNGAVSVNTINYEIESYIQDTDSADAVDTSVTALNDITLAADDNSSTSVIAGQVAGTVGQVAAGAAVGIVSVGYEQAVDENTEVLNARNGNDLTTTPSHKVRAYVDSAALTSQAGKVDLAATSNTAIFNITAGAAVAGTAALQGSVSVNNVNTEIATSISNSTIIAQDDVNLASVTAKRETMEQGAFQPASDSTETSSFDGDGDAATNNSRNLTSIQSLAGSITGGGSAAVGAAVAVNTIGNKIDAGIIGSTVTSNTGDVNLSGQSEATIETISAAIAASGSFAGVGSVSVNHIENQVGTLISGSTVTANNATDTIFPGPVPGVVMVSQDKSTIRALSGQISGSGTATLGAAVASNKIENIVSSGVVSGSIINTTGNVVVSADSDATIESIAAGGSFGGSAGIAGKVAVNIVDNDVEAVVEGASAATTVNADDNIYILADSDNKIHAYGGAIAGGAVGFSASVATNFSDNTIKAYVDHASVSAKGTGAEMDVKSWADDGTESTATAKGLFVVADADEEIKLYTGSLGAGAVAIAGQVSVNQVKDTTEAYILGSNINDAVDLGQEVQVKAHNDTDVDVFAGSISVGGAAFGAAVDTTFVDNTTSAFITSSNDATPVSSVVYGRGVEVTSQTRERVDTLIGGASIAGGIAVAGVVSVVDIDNNNDAYIKDSDVVSLGDVQVNADDDAQISTRAGVVAVGATTVGAGGSVAVNTIKNVTGSSLDGAHVNATGAIGITTDTDEKIITRVGTAGVGLGGGVAGAVSVNTVESTSEATVRDSATGRKALINQDTDFQLGGANVLDTTQTVLVKADDYASVNAEAGSLAGGAVGVGAAIDVGAIRNRTVSSVDSGSKIYSVGNIGIEALSDRDIDSTTAAVAGGLIGLSGAISVVSLGAAVDSDGAAEFNGSLTTQVNGDIAVGGLAVDTSDNNANEANNRANALTGPSVSDDLSTTMDTTTKVTAAIVADSADAASRAEIISASGNINVEATNTRDVIIKAGQVSVGAASLGASVGVANINSMTTAAVGKYNYLEAGGNVDIVASDKPDPSEGSSTSIYVDSGTVGISGSGGGWATINSTVDTDAFLGDNAVIEDAADVTIKVDQKADVYADGDGLTIAGAATGSIVTKTSIDSDADAYVGANARIGSAAKKVNSLTVQALTNNKATANSAAVAGGVSSGAAAQADADINTALTRAYLGNNASVATAADLEISAQSINETDADADGSAYGAAASGIVKTSSTIENSTTAYTGTAVILDVGNDLTVKSDASNTINAYGVGGLGGLIASGGVDVDAELFNNTSYAKIGDSNQINNGVLAARDVYVTSLNQADVQAEGKQDNSGGAITNVQVDATSKITNSLTKAEIGSSSILNVGSLELMSNDTSIFAKGKGSSKVYQAAGYSTADVLTDVDVLTLAEIGLDADITAPVSLKIISRQDSVKTDATAITEIAGGFTGSLTSIADNQLDANADVDVKTGVKLKTTDLYVEANTPIAAASQDGYVRVSNTTANTVVNYVWDVVGTACKWVWTILTFGLWDGKEICDPVMGWVRTVTNSDANAIRNGYETRNSNIDFNAAVTILGGLNPELLIDAAGIVTSAVGLTYTDNGSEIVIDDITNTSTGKIEFASPSGHVSGDATFEFKDIFENVNIDNASAKNITINNVDLINKNKTDPDITIGVNCSDGSCGDHTPFNYNMVANFTNTQVDINSSGAGDVSFNGHLDNAGGTTTVDVVAGDILSGGSGAIIESNNLSLTSQAGSIGTPVNPINTVLVQADTLTPSVTATAKEGIYGNLQAVLREDSTLMVDIGPMVSDGVIQLDLPNGLKETVDTSTVPSTVLSTAVNGSFMLDNITVAGDITINGGNLVTYDVQGIVSSGDQDVDFNIAAGGDISANPFDYTVSQTATEIVIDDLQQRGGFLTLTGKELTGTGTLQVLDGYAHVNITNDSDKDLRLGNIDIDNRINGQMTFNGSDLLATPDDTVSSLSYGYSAGAINVDNTGIADIKLNGDLLNSSGITNLTATDGNIVQLAADKVSKSMDLVVSADLGTVGTSTSRLRTDLVTGGSVTLSSDGDVYLYESEGANGGITLGPVTSTNGLVDVHSLGDINVSTGGVSALNGTVLLDADTCSDINVDATISTSSGDVDLLAEGDVDFGSSGTVNSSSGNVLIQAGDPTCLNCGTITMFDGSVINAGSGTIDLQSVEDITLGSLQTSNDTVNAVTISSSTKGVLDGGDSNVDIIANSTDAVVTINAVSGINADTQVATLYAANSGSGDLIINEADSINLVDTQVSAGSLTVSAAGNINQSNGSASVDASLTSTGGSIVSTTLTAASDVTVAAQAGTVDLTDTTATAGNMMVTASGNVGQLRGAVGGNALLTSNSGSVDSNDLAVGSNLTMQAATGITQNLGSAGLDASLTSTSGNIVSTTLIAIDDVMVAAQGGMANLTNTTATAGSLTVSAASDVTQLNGSAGIDASIISGGAISSDILAAAGNLTLSGTGNVSQSSGTAGFNATLTSTASSVSSDNLSAGKNLTVQASTGITQNLGSAGVDASLTSTTGDIVSTTLTAGNNVAVDAQDGAAQLTDTTATAGALTVTASGNVTQLRGAVGGNALISSSGGAVSSDDLSAGNNLILQAVTGITQNLGSAGVDASLTSTTGDIVSTTLTAGNDVAVDAQGGMANLTTTTATAGSLTVTAASDVTQLNGSAGIDASITSGGAIFSDTLDSGSNLILQAATGITQNIGTAGFDATLTSAGGNIVSTALTAANDVTVDAQGGAAQLTDTTATAGSLTVTAASDVTQDNGQAGVDAVISSGTGDIIINTGLVAGSVVNLNATTGSIYNDGFNSTIVTSGHLSADSLNGVDLSTAVDTLDATASSFGDVVINETDSIELVAISTADGAVTVSAGDTVAATSVIAVDAANSRNHDVVISSGNNIDVGYIGTTAGDVLLTANNSINDLNNDPASNIDAVSLTLIAQNGDIGSAGNHLDIDSSNAVAGVLDASADGDIYITEVDGDLVADQIVANTGSIGLAVLNGGLFANQISSPAGDIGLTVYDSLQIDLLSARNLDLQIQVEGGQASITEARIGQQVTTLADNIDYGLVLNTDNSSELIFDARGNDGLMADTININASSVAPVRFNRYIADSGTVNAQVDHLIFSQALVGSTASYRNNYYEVIVDNDPVALYNTDAQLFSRGQSFDLVMFKDNFMATDAYIVHYNDNFILNDFSTENSFYRFENKILVLNNYPEYPVDDFYSYRKGLEEQLPVVAGENEGKIEIDRDFMGLDQGAFIGRTSEVKVVSY